MVMASSEESVSAESVIEVQRQRINDLQWELTVTEAKLKDARAQLAEITSGQKTS